MKPKVVVLGSLQLLPETQASELRSLNHIEHVSPTSLMRSEISRPSIPKSASRQDALLLSALRRWFWTRKPDAGFVLSEFPATLLHAMVLSEWLDARDEALDVVLFPTSATHLSDVVQYYRQHGLLMEGLVKAA